MAKKSKRKKSLSSCAGVNKRTHKVKSGYKWKRGGGCPVPVAGKAKRHGGWSAAAAAKRVAAFKRGEIRAKEMEKEAALQRNIEKLYAQGALHGSRRRRRRRR